MNSHFNLGLYPALKQTEKLALVPSPRRHKSVTLLSISTFNRSIVKLEFIKSWNFTIQRILTRMISQKSLLRNYMIILYQNSQENINLKEVIEHCVLCSNIWNSKKYRIYALNYRANLL